MKKLIRALQATKAWRAWKRYGDARGNILAAGIGYFAFFSIFPAVALAFTVFGFVLGRHPELLSSIAANLNANLPGFVKDSQHPQGLIPIKAPRAGALTITGALAFVSLVLAGMGWLGAVREGVRAVFGVQGSVGNLITTKLRDLGVLFTLGLGIALSAVLTSVVGAAAGWIADRIGMSGQGWVLVLAGLAVSVVADTGLMLLLIRVLSGVHFAWRDLLPGAFLGGVGFSLLKLSASTLLPRVTANPLFASIAIVVGLLFWLNLISRLTLISAAWAANDVEETHSGDEVHGGDEVHSGDEVHGGGPRPLADGRAAAGATGPVPPRGQGLPTFGVRAGDRTTLAAGAVLGATTVVATGALARGIRAVARLVKN